MMPAAIRRTSWFPEILSDFLDVNMVPRTGVTAPAMNVRESDGGYEVEVAAPGMTKDDFNVSLNRDGDLTIRMESRKEASEGDGKSRYIRREFSLGRYERTIVLPEDVDRDGISAKVVDGVLLVVLPKTVKEDRPEERRILVG